MISFVPGKDRWKLGFKEAVLRNFQFLRGHGLECAQSDVTFVRYDSPKIFFRAENPESRVPKMAALFRKYAEPLFVADEESFKSFDDYCTLDSIRLGDRYATGATRWKAARAFQRKDWKQVIQSYESMREDISQGEAAELAYAQQQVLAAETVDAGPNA